jgi:hypothetical protein
MVAAGKQGPLGYIPVFIANALYPLKYVLTPLLYFCCPCPYTRGVVDWA